MTCLERYAEAWQYASFFAVAPIQHGLDDSGGAGNANLQDSQANFNDAGIRPNVGMILYNLGQGASPTIVSGPVTGVTAETLTATGVTWDNGDTYRTVAINGSQIATIENYLAITAGNINGTLASVGACDCTFSTWGLQLLEKLNVIETGAYHFAPCGMPSQRLSTEDKRMLLEQVNLQLGYIRSGEVEVCDGETGSTFPVTGWAEQGHTAFNRAQIVLNRINRTGG